jgi:Ca2+-binding RTX toxin-like protein
MDSTDNFSHTGVSGSSPGDRMKTAGYGAQGWGENIAYVSGTLSEATVKQLHTNLMNSPGHYANIVRGSFEEIGIGLKQGTINGHNVVFVTQNFGTPNSSERAEPNDVGGTSTPTTPTVPKPTEPTTAKGKSIIGTSSNNTLYGTSGDDTLNGNAGKDSLWGRGGDDTFVFDTAREANGDTIRDFNGSDDIIKLSGIDANTSVSGNQAFKFIGTQGFHKTAGELKAYEVKGNTYIAGDTDGNGYANFTIKVLGDHSFTKGDFVL